MESIALIRTNLERSDDLVLRRVEPLLKSYDESDLDAPSVAIPKG